MFNNYAQFISVITSIFWDKNICKNELEGLYQVQINYSLISNVYKMLNNWKTWIWHYEKYNDVDCTAQDFQICNWVENISL